MSQYVDPVPEGWEVRLDDTTKTYYFIDHNNQRTQWQHPINKLVYRPQQMQNPQNGYQSMQIPINRNQIPPGPVGFAPELQPQFNRTGVVKPFPPATNGHRIEERAEPVCSIYFLDKTFSRPLPVNQNSQDPMNLRLLRMSSKRQFP